MVRLHFCTSLGLVHGSFGLGFVERGSLWLVVLDFLKSSKSMQMEKKIGSIWLGWLFLISMKLFAT